MSASKEHGGERESQKQFDSRGCPFRERHPRDDQRKEKPDKPGPMP